jgi:predicted kinase
MKAIITVGVSASGKTTWARKFQKENLDDRWFILSRDDIRYHILDEKSLIDDYSMEGIPWKNWNWKWEKEVTERFWRNALFIFAHHRPLIIADTNLNSARLKDMIERLKEIGYTDIELKYFPITFEEACARDARRPNGVGVSVIAKQIDQWNERDENIPLRYVNDLTKPPAVIVDIDGTLAHMNGRGPFEWDKVHHDKVDFAVSSVVRGLHERGFRVIIVSGRDGVCEQLTKNWLAMFDIPYQHFFIREAGDMRKDTIIKKEIFDNHIRDRYNVVMVIDDRPSVCRMWRALGLKVMQVGNPYIEF